MENYGIYIRGSRYIKQIMTGEKTVETRNCCSLDEFIGKRVAVIQSGRKGGAAVVGYVTITGRKFYDADSFHDDNNQLEHRVPAGSKYDVSGAGKYGYILSEPVAVSPVLVERVISSYVYQPLPFTEEDTAA